MPAGIEPQPMINDLRRVALSAFSVAGLERHLAVPHGREDLQWERDPVALDLSRVPRRHRPLRSSSSSQMSSSFVAFAVDEFGCQWRWSLPFRDGGSPCSLSNAVVVFSRSGPMELRSPGIVRARALSSPLVRRRGRE